jgi:hypothetical protein
MVWLLQPGKLVVIRCTLQLRRADFGIFLRKGVHGSPVLA